LAAGAFPAVGVAAEAAAAGEMGRFGVGCRVGADPLDRSLGAEGAPSPAAGRLDAEDVSGLDVDLELARQVDDGPVGSDQAVPSRLAGAAPGQAVGGRLSAVRDEADPGRGQELDFPDHSVAAPVAALAAGAPPNRVSPDADGEQALDGLDGRVHRVRHVGVDGALAVAVGAGAGPAADGLVEGKGPALKDASKGQVVHRPLGGGRDAVGHGLGEGAQDDVHDPLGRLDVAGRDGCRGPGVDDGPLGGDDRDGAEEAVVGRGVALQEGPEAVPHGRQRHGVNGIDAPPALGVGAREVDDGLGRPDCDGGPDANGLLGEAVVVQAVLEDVGALGDLSQGLAHQGLCVIQQGPTVEEDLFPTVLADELPEALGAYPAGIELGEQVALPLLRRPDVGQQDSPEVFVPRPPPV